MKSIKGIVVFTFYGAVTASNLAD